MIDQKNLLIISNFIFKSIVFKFTNFFLLIKTKLYWNLKYWMENKNMIKNLNGDQPVF